MPQSRGKQGTKMPNLNAMCCGSHCASDSGEVRMYPLGGGGNLILCRACFAHENRYRQERARETQALENFPLWDWDKAEIYEGAQS